MSCHLVLAAPTARLTLDAPPVNVIDLTMIAAMKRAIDDVAARRDVAVLIIDAASERAFSAGVDVEDHLPARLDRMLDEFHALCRGLYELEAVTLALVQGPALGGAMELLACCDFVLAAEEADFAQPEIDLACFPPLGAALYPKRFGPKAAAEIVLLGRRFTAAEAAELGLVTKVVARSDLASEGEALVATLCEKSPAALAIAKRALRLGHGHLFDGLEAIEALYREELAATKDMVEGLTAFLEKRRPRFEGK